MNKMFTFMRESGPARAFIPIGIILIIFGVIMFIINNKNQNYLEVVSTVSNVVERDAAYLDADGNHVDATYDITIKYTVDDKEYEGTLENVGKYNIGDKVTIYYNPNDPTQITQTKSLIIPMVIIILGIISFVAGIISATKAIKRYKESKKQEEGWANAK